MQTVPVMHGGCLMAKLWVNWVFNISKADLAPCLCSSKSHVAFLSLMTRSTGSYEVNVLKLTVIELLTYLSAFENDVVLCYVSAPRL